MEERSAQAHVSEVSDAADSAAATRRRGWRAGSVGAISLCGALCLLVEPCSSFGVASGFLGPSQGLRSIQRRSARLSLPGQAPGAASVRYRPAERQVKCSIALNPSTIYTCGDWGLLLPPAEQPKRPALPRLTTAELQALQAGDRVQRQSRVGPVGHGLVVMDVKADMATVMAVLSDVQRYPQRIGTVREAVVDPGGFRNLCKARFKLSRYKLDVQVELYLSKARNMLEFRLDKSAGMQGAVFDEARGYWYLEPSVDGTDGCTRVWLNARVQCSPLLPAGVVDYAATKALPRATTWLAPVCEAVQTQLDQHRAAGNGAPAGSMLKDVHSLGPC